MFICYKQIEYFSLGLSKKCPSYQLDSAIIFLHLVKIAVPQQCMHEVYIWMKQQFLLKAVVSTSKLKQEYLDARTTFLSVRPHKSL